MKGLRDCRPGEVFFIQLPGRHIWKMGAVYTYDHQQGLFVFLGQIIQRGRNDHPVVVDHRTLSASHKTGGKPGRIGGCKSASLLPQPFCRAVPAHRSRIRRDPPGKAVALVDTHKMHPAAQHGLIARRHKWMQDRGLCVGKAVKIREDPRTSGPLSAHHSHPRGYTQRAGGVRVVKAHTIRRKSVQIWGIHISSQPAGITGTVLVAHKNQDVSVHTGHRVRL